MQPIDHQVSAVQATEQVSRPTGAGRVIAAPGRVNPCAGHVIPAFLVPRLRFTSPKLLYPRNGRYTTTWSLISSSGMHSAISRMSSMAEPMDCSLVVTIRPGTTSPAATRW